MSSHQCHATILILACHTMPNQTMPRLAVTATNTTLFNLVTWAYGIGYSCFIVSDQGLVSGRVRASDGRPSRLSLVVRLKRALMLAPTRPKRRL